MKNAKCYKKGYPRPQFVRENWLDLNGTWDFCFDDENIGLKEKWYRNLKTNSQINVPFAYQTKLSGIHDESDHIVMWYAKKQLFNKPKKNERIFLNFEGVDYKASVYVNGLYIGSHIGGYCRFSLDITDALDKIGNAYIVVRVEDDLSCTHPRGKQSWAGHPFGCWYTPTSGIWKSVWAEVVSSTHINRIKMTPNESNMHMEFEYEINNFKKGCSLRTIVSYNDTIIADNKMALIRENQAYAIDFSNDLDGFKIHWWTNNNPQFYDIEFILEDEKGNVLDRVGSYNGFRIFKTEKQMLKLNLNPIYLRMTLEQGYWRDSGLTPASEEELLNQLLLIKELGFNGVRMHQKIEDERFYYFADMLGLLVWCELPSGYEYRDTSIEATTKEWIEVVKQNYNHPSIIVWVPVNESWGVNQLTSNKRQAHFTEALYYLTKAYDSMRPVISNDGWEHTTSDIITLHNYTQDSKLMTRFYKDIEAMFNGANRVDFSQFRTTFVDGYSYRGQPIMIDEFAGIGFQNKNDEGWGYGDKVKSQEAYINRLHSLVGSIVAMDYIAGFCITQTTDVYQEINGLLDFDRIEKVDKELLRKAITQ